MDNDDRSKSMHSPQSEVYIPNWHKGEPLQDKRFTGGRLDLKVEISQKGRPSISEEDSGPKARQASNEDSEKPL